MPSHIPELFRDAGRKIIGPALRKMVGQPAASLNDETAWQQRVVTPAWKELPLPCKLLGRRRLKWEELFTRLRDAAYDTSSGTVQFRPEAGAETTGIFKDHVQTLGEVLKVSVGETTTSIRPQPSQPESSPGSTLESPEPASADAPTIGIDLGTTYSVVAYVDSQGRPITIDNAAGELLTPSVVCFEDDGIVVGREAMMAGAMEPHRVAECVKRDMGSRSYSKQINGESVPPEVISSMVLRSLKADAERRLGPVSKAVITVPAYFDEPRRMATIDAGRLAGLEVLDIINEPTAAAVCFGYQLGFLDPKKGTGDNELIRVLVYDLGGGTFDVTVLEIRGTSFKAVATDGDVRLGGKDWDEKLVEMAAERYLAEHGEDPRNDTVSLQELWSAAETAKKTLTERAKAVLYLSHGGTRMKVEITRAEFEEETAGLLMRTRHTCDIVLREASLQWSDIDRILLVGGSTRMPMVGDMLEQLAPGRPVDRSLSPDAAVAHGAALYADMLVQRKRAETSSDKAEARFELTNVNSHSLGIVGIENLTKRKINHVLIPRNTPLPHSVSRVFKTAKTDQRSVKIEVLEGESQRPDHCTLVGVSSIKGLPAGLPAGAPVEISYRYEENGQLHVSGRVVGQDAAVQSVFARDNNLPENDLMAWSEYVAHETRQMQE